jgi:dissimilatory sulfite reductase (desulfoviridin) alpha/beta subunit
MRWSKEAQAAMDRVPFFVRKRVRNRVEEEARREGASEVVMLHVRACQQRMLDGMESEVKGYSLEVCFGASGCPHRLVHDRELVEGMERMLVDSDLKAFLRQRVKGQLKFHHEFRVSVACCPNACSRPQIADFGLIGACRPQIAGEACSLCGACQEICQEGAISLPPSGGAPDISHLSCVACGQCAAACPTGTIIAAPGGYRVLLGGKLGRHPQLGRELPDIHASGEVLEVFGRCLHHYLRNNRSGERFGEILNRLPMERREEGEASEPARS